MDTVIDEVLDDFIDQAVADEDLSKAENLYHFILRNISFLDRYDNEIKQLIEKSTQMTFVYPHEAYTYSISLLSAGVKELDFYSLKLEETGEEHV